MSQIAFIPRELVDGGWVSTEITRVPTPFVHWEYVATGSLPPFTVGIGGDGMAARAGSGRETFTMGDDLERAYLTGATVSNVRVGAGLFFRKKSNGQNGTFGYSTASVSVVTSSYQEATENVPFFTSTGVNPFNPDLAGCPYHGILEHEYALNPVTGVSWTVAEIFAYDFGVRLIDAGGDDQFFISDVFLLIDFTEPATTPTAGQLSWAEIGAPPAPRYFWVVNHVFLGGQR